MKSESEREIGVMRASGERDAMKEKYRREREQTAEQRSERETGGK